MAIWQFEVALRSNETASERTDSNINGPDLKSLGLFHRCGDDIAQRIDRILPRRDSWSESMVLWGEEDGNRLHAVLENDEIVELTARIDLRQPPGSFCTQLVEFARDIGAHFLTVDDRLVPADLRAMAEAIRRSDSFRFVLDPQQYIRDLASNAGGLPSHAQP